MSHYSVIVIGPDIAGQLQPYHEFECTGTDDQYVVDVDITDELRAEYQSGSRTYYELPSGRVTRDDPKLYREFTAAERKRHPHPFGSSYGSEITYESRDWGDGRGYRALVFDPKGAGAIEVEVPYVECMMFSDYVRYARGDSMPTIGPNQDPKSFASAKHHYMRTDSSGTVVAVIDRTNPNGKWDYWRMGGRWSGFLPIKGGGKANSCYVRDLDLDGARSDAAREANATFDKWEALVAKHGKAEAFGAIREREADMVKVRKVYNGQPLIAASRDLVGIWSDPVEEIGYDRDAYVQRCERRALVPYAVVKDSKWHARGKMGFFAFSRDAMTEDEWCEQFHRLLDGLAPDTMLTIVDCHT